LLKSSGKSFEEKNTKARFSRGKIASGLAGNPPLRGDSPGNQALFYKRGLHDSRGVTRI